MRRINHRQAIALLLILVVGMSSLAIEVKHTTAALVESSVVSTTPNQDRVLPRVVFFGSSTTVGVGAPRGDRRWTTLLSHYLGWQEFNEGLSGSTLTKYPRAETSLWDIPSAVERWQEVTSARRPDLVVMMYGANDAYRRLPLGSSTSSKSGTFQGDLKTLLTGLRSVLQPQQLVVLTPQPNSATQERRAPYDLALQKSARQVGAFFIDTGSEAFSSLELPEYSDDGLHPNHLGHAAIASFMAGKIVDFGLVPPPPVAQGGNDVAGKLVPLPSGYLRIDLDSPLKFGEIRAIEAKWVAPGQAVLAVMRPNGRGGYEVIYRTSRFPVSPGTARTVIPRWWVLDGDRLAVWTAGDCLGGRELPLGSAHHISFSTNADIYDLTAADGEPDSHRLAIRAVTP